ncbi:OmpA family protein [Tenacibaculum holothuriorum]|uniref:OmpA family protein n=1 Tax=Tenacibaculum holothuriorum TaxID=1635173 RepID=UPI000A324433|nr:OmpA family protein [Tenacibaculum holothuriorum]
MTVVFVNGQSKRVADRYYDEFSYIESAKLYKALVEEKGDTTKHVLSRLADSYYNNANTEEAETWYGKLLEKYQKDLSPKYFFKYAQVLRSNGKYKKSDSIFKLIASEDEINNRREELQNTNYLLDYSTEEVQKISLRNLAINTPYSDFGGFIVNGQVYFTSSVPKNTKKEKIYKWNNQPFLNIYKATEDIQLTEEDFERQERDTVLEVVNPELIIGPVTTDVHESTPIFTKDGKTMYFTRNNFNGKRRRKSKKNTSNLKIYKASFVNGAWIKVTELPFNNDEYSVGHPALSADEKKLYFASDMPGGFGGSDLYSVTINEDGTYGDPKNLGKKINTSDKELFPFIGKDSTLYFSSNGHLGFGLLDIFQSKIKNDSTFTAPKNLGDPFNSKKDDFSFFLAEDGKRGFFSSNRKKGKGDDDIYSFYIYTTPAICKQVIAGVITNSKTKTPVNGAVVKLINNEGKVIEEAITDIAGNYKFNEVLCDAKFTVKVSKLNYKPNKKATQTTVTAGGIVKSNVELIPLIVGDQIVINPIYFDYGKSVIRDDAQYELENIVTVLNNHPELVIKIEAHTDSRGPDDYNKKLSDRRAKATRDFILSRGIKAKQIESAIGYGEEQLLNHCNNANQKKCSEKEHQANRRSYFYIVKGNESIKAREEAEIIKVQKRISKRNSFLQFLRKNMKKKGNTTSDKCLIGEEENCKKDKKKFKVIYRNQ